MPRPSRLRLRLPRLVATVSALAVAPGAMAVPVKTAHVEAELVAATSAIVPGEPITVALRLVLQKGWHTYWRNPGDSGLPTTLAWTLPAGIEAGPIEWPAPRMLPVGPLVNYGYEGEALHLVQLSPAAFARSRHDGHTRGARGLARVQGSVHPGRRRPDAGAAGGADCRTGHALGSRARRRARRAAATARRLARQRGGPGHDDHGDVRAAAPVPPIPERFASFRTSRTGSIRPDRSPSRATATRSC